MRDVDRRSPTHPGREAHPVPARRRSRVALARCRILWLGHADDGAGLGRRPERVAIDGRCHGAITVRRRAAAPGCVLDLHLDRAPIDLTVALEADNTVQATIPTDGGEISATGADGTVYTLTIPGDALLEPTEITMTPVASVAGLPIGGEATHAVQLGPDGLQLEDFAVLTIAPTEPIPVDQQVDFGYEGDGKAMFLALPVVKDPQIRLEVLHFSGYAVTKGLLASLDDARKLAGEADTRLTNYLAVFLAKQHALAMAGHEVASDFWDAFEDIVKAYERDVVEPRVAAAGKSCAAGRLAMESVQNLDRQRQLHAVRTTGLGLEQARGHGCARLHAGGVRALPGRAHRPSDAHGDPGTSSGCAS